MSWWKQVWHVTKKDVREFRWVLGVQVLATVMAAAMVVDSGSHGGPRAGGILLGLSNLVNPSMVLAGIAVLISALVVQADSPSRSDAFWASKPLHPLAVLTSKAVTLGVFLLALPLVAEAIALRQHAVSPAQMVPLLAESVISQAGIVVGAAALAALTANLSTFFVA